MKKENNLGMGVTFEHHDHEAEKKAAFEAQQEVMDKIYSMGFSEYIKEVPNFEDAFDLSKHIPEKIKNLGNKKCVCCMDERTNYGIHVAGSAILLSEEEREKYMTEENPDIISSHDGCGAAKLYCRLNGLPEEKSDEIGREYAREEARKRGIGHVHFDYSDMVGSPDFHHARSCYIDAVGNFNYGREDNLLPAGFVVNLKSTSLKNALAENSVADTIMFGDHGLKNYFSPENPFLTIIIARTEEELDSLKKELSQSIGDNPLIKIDGFVKN